MSSGTGQVVEQQVAFRSLDGLTLRGTLAVPGEAPSAIAVLVHGGGVTREEGGFFTRLAAALAAAGVASLRFASGGSHYRWAGGEERSPDGCAEPGEARR